ncbi:TetR family transcriptional regulator [Brachybacterium sp. P6-10-X1]|uniref:TetR/AcrR family transcriptional regulator n=1 Tax=Brachybacterium sp. P6-10-X1 TaxID=1903186 RepID=UPI000971767A|nr:TetR/AcrR family transcriptional regulator [Brachybacterium sp. P6-10-X1]APX33221.1 TetR family transcriptional regulator [Brachybacterium sp. P6-10-X1]
MSSATPPASDHDLTARARLRDAALIVYARHGAKGATVQAIAAEAGVSTGLIRHHFGSKDGLLAACDAHAIGTLLEQAREALAEDSARPGFATGMYHSSRPEVRYLARALVDGSRSADELYEVSTDLAERFLSERWPDRFVPGSQAARDAAAVMTTMHLGQLVLHTQLSRRIGVDSLDPAHAPRVGAAMTALYSAMGEFFSAGHGKRLADDLDEGAGESHHHPGGQ